MRHGRSEAFVVAFVGSWADRPSWPGGVAAAVRESRDSHLNAADGVVAQDRKSLVDFGPPPRPLQQRKLREIFLSVASTPPGQEGQWIADQSHIHRLRFEVVLETFNAAFTADAGLFESAKRHLVIHD